MLRRMAVLLFALEVLLGTAVRAEASETGSIRVTLAEENQTVTSGSVTLYRAGTPVRGGYRLDDAFGGGMVKWGDLPSEALAPWLAEHIWVEGVTLLLDADGSAEFSDLEPGLYLLVQEEAMAGYTTMEPFVVELPYEDLWQLRIFPPTQLLEEAPPPTGQNPAPVAAFVVLVFSSAGLMTAAAGKRRERKGTPAAGAGFSINR